MQQEEQKSAPIYTQDDDAKYSIDNLDNLSEEEILEVAKRYKEKNLPKWRLKAFLAYNIVFAGLTMYGTVNYRYYTAKFFKPRKYSLSEIIKIGTIQSASFVALYLFGTAAVTGLWNPVQYGRDLAKIHGKIVDNQIKFDKTAQKHVLFGFMEYFGLSPKVMEFAQQELDRQKQELEQRNYFMKKKAGEEEEEDE
mmetsp:Transcript_56956/g.65253  ORF Transcript_56956/g.65253 Transcript_56956/m.65253 type:complete len:195 (-) Transcript_56956:80-664(-)